MKRNKIVGRYGGHEGGRRKGEKKKSTASAYQRETMYVNVDERTTTKNVRAAKRESESRNECIIVYKVGGAEVLRYGVKMEPGI